MGTPPVVLEAAVIPTPERRLCFKDMVVNQGVCQQMSKRFIVYNHHVRIASHLVPVLTETNLTVISNKECTEYLKGNSSNNMRFQIVMNLNLRKGVTNQMLCTTGYQTDNGWTVSFCDRKLDKYLKVFIFL